MENLQIQQYLNEVKANPDNALNKINNVKIKLEMERNALEAKISEMEEVLIKINNPVIQEMFNNIKKASTIDELNETNSTLNELEQTVLGEIETMLQEDNDLMSILNREYSQPR